MLAQLREGNQKASDQLFPLVYAELRRMASAYMQHERPGHTLQATALVNEAYVRLVGANHAHWENRAHFFSIAAHTMRQVLVSYAVRRHAGSAAVPEREKWTSIWSCWSPRTGSKM